MVTAECVRCARPLADGAYVCSRCTADAAQKLAEIVELAPAARDVAHGLSRRSQGGASGKPGSRLPLDLTATAKLDAVSNELGTWVRHIVEARGCHVWSHDDDPIAFAANWLATQLEWLRHRPEADEAFGDFAAAVRVLRGIARGPSEQKYLGPCGALLLAEVEPEDPTLGIAPEHETQICDGDVYGYRGADTGTCRTCGAQVDQAERRAWLDDEVRQHAFRAAHIADAYGISVDTIRSWAGRGKLASYWRTEAGITTPWVDPALDPKLTGEDMERRLGEISDEIKARGGRLHYVGDVLDLAAADAARREENRAKRERRAAARETAEMGA